MLVATPRIRNSATARRARSTASSKVRPRQVSLVSIESKCAETSAPVYVVPPSSRMPAPPGDRYAVIRPVSGRKPLAGSSVVIRHCSATPRVRTLSCRRPRSASVSPDGDPQLGLDQVDIGDFLGDRVLDLDAGVHLDEDVPAVGRDEELDGAGVDVADLLGEGDGVVADALAQLRVEVWAPARSRRPSGVGAAASSHARTGGSRCRWRRRGSAPRCGAGRSRPPRRRPSGRRRRRRPRASLPRPSCAGRRGRRRGACRVHRRRRRP